MEKIDQELPEELKKQLTKNFLSPKKNDIKIALKELGKTNIDNILIHIYKTTGRIKKRSNVTQNLYNLLKKGKIKRSEGFYWLVGEETNE